MTTFASISAAIRAIIAATDPAISTPLWVWVQQCDASRLTAFKVKIAEAMLHARICCRYPAADCFSAASAEFHWDALVDQGVEPEAACFSAEELELLADIAD